jgi:mannose-6-phosphate isomerase-like protein (cupin superfamily)
LIPLAEAQHFDREGFSGDILVPKEARLGFTALQVTVEGAHPLKQILAGNTRSYFVTDGTGTFVLNGEPKVVTKGDMVVIPSGSQYEYRGTMTLFEFNVSPSNTFRDKLVESPKAEPEPTIEDDHSLKPQREKLGHAIAEIIKRGYTLTNKDLAAIIPHYGYSSKNQVGFIVSPASFRKIIEANGALLDWQTYKNREIYLDGNVPLAETDIADTHAKIDAIFKFRKRG